MRALQSIRTLLVAAAPCAVAAAQTPQWAPSAHAEDQSQLLGYWQPAFNHDMTGFPGFQHDGEHGSSGNETPSFNAIHMALVPVGPHRGKVFAIDQDVENDGPFWHQRLSIVEPREDGSADFVNWDLDMPEGGGDLFCCGHTWLETGHLLVAGGTTNYPVPDQEPFKGGRLIYVVDFEDFSQGPLGTWHLQEFMDQLRWYPTCTLLPDGRVVMSGGVPTSWNDAHNDYEVWVPDPSGAPGGALEDSGIGHLYPGPVLPASKFTIYPRMHLMPTGEVFLSGMGAYCSKFDHTSQPGAFTPMALSSVLGREYGSGAHFVNLDPDPARRFEVMCLGGETRAMGVIGTVVTDNVELFRPSLADPQTWDPVELAPMHFKRKHANAVVLPDKSVLVIGGQQAIDIAPVPQAVLTPEIYDFETDTWQLLPPHTSRRMYHSTAVLLPDGRVFTGGADTRDADYQIFVPHYIASGATRPEILRGPTDWAFASQGGGPYTYRVGAMPASRVTKAVLMRPGSVTHHFDYDQRYVEVEVVGTRQDTISIAPPADSATAPRGWYMLFVLSDSDVPSEAHWVNLQ